MAMHAVAPERRGAASSTFFVAFDLGIALGGFLAGVLIRCFGYDTMFLLINLSCVLSLVYYFSFGHNHASSFNPARRREAVRDEASAPMSAGTATAGTPPLVVTISREFGSGGHRIGELLSQRLGIPLYDKELIALTARESGFSEATSRKVREANAKLEAMKTIFTDYKKTVKTSYLPDRWADFGILDKR